MREFATGATRNNDDGKNEYGGFESPYVIKMFGDYMTEHRVQGDGKLRASNNWKKGMARDVFFQSAFRHFVDFWFIHEAYQDEVAHGEVGVETEYQPGLVEALCALRFNIQGYMHELAIGRDVGIPQDAVATSVEAETKWQHIHCLEGKYVWVDCGTTLKAGGHEATCSLPQDIAHLQAKRSPQDYRQVAITLPSGIGYEDAI